MTDKKHAMITGANKGIGHEAARQLAAQGMTVWLGARDPELGEAAVETLRRTGGDVRFVQIDVTDLESVRLAAETVSRATARLDILVNNAGIAGDQGSTPSSLDIDVMRAIYEVNVFGPVRTTQAFLPLVKAAPAGRIVMVSSGLGSVAAQADRSHWYYGVNLLGYSTSKTALNSVMVAFSKELADAGIKVNAADPGYTATDLNSHAGTKTVAQGAAIIVQLATLPDDGPTGGFFNDEGPVTW
jgi:NAD(P)-dependent dehydrogenase (short-subunit alcohol dehydrogenase family)